MYLKHLLFQGLLLVDSGFRLLLGRDGSVGPGAIPLAPFCLVNDELRTRPEATF
jgi:hypothetical protein